MRKEEYVKEYILKWKEENLGKVCVYSADEEPKINTDDLVIETAEQLAQQSLTYDLLGFCDAISSQAIIQAVANQGKVVYSAELKSRLPRAFTSARKYQPTDDPYGQNWVRH